MKRNDIIRKIAEFDESDEIIDDVKDFIDEIEGRVNDAKDYLDRINGFDNVALIEDCHEVLDNLSRDLY